MFCLSNFSLVADTIQRILVQKGLKILHYLDVFIFISGSFEEADSQKQLLIDTFKTLGVPLETSKLEGPATCLIFLDIEFDTVSLQIHLPSQKLLNLKSELLQPISCKCITKRNLWRLSGLLQYATKVICLGGAFLHRLLCSIVNWTLSFSSHLPHCSCMRWWHVFASEWNGLFIVELQ